MRPDILLLLMIGTALSMPLNAREKPLQVLRNNPFSQPEILRQKLAGPASEPEVPADEINLVVTATMVSATAPMAVVAGELMSVGDSIRGMKLIEVQDERVVFLHHGKQYLFEITYESTAE